MQTHKPLLIELHLDLNAARNAAAKRQFDPEGPKAWIRLQTTKRKNSREEELACNFASAVIKELSDVASNMDAAVVVVGWIVGTVQRYRARDEMAKTDAEIGSRATGAIETISNVFKGGEIGAEAQRELISMCGAATFVIALLFICYLAATALGRFSGGIVAKKVDVTRGKFLSKAIRNMIMLVVAMVALEVIWDINVVGFSAILVAVGFAIGMALQGTLGNVAAGVMLLIFRPFKIDDYIVVAGTEGTVEEIDLFTTRLNAPDNRHLIIPNGEIFGAKLENYSRNKLRRVDVNVGAAYSADLCETRTALERAVTHVREQCAKAVGSVDVPAAQVYLQEQGASSVDWQMRVWCCPEDYWVVRELLTAAAKESLDRSGISIPFPQMDVHVVGKVLAKAA